MAVPISSAQQEEDEAADPAECKSREPVPGRNINNFIIERVVVLSQRAGSGSARNRFLLSGKVRQPFRYLCIAHVHFLPLSLLSQLGPADILVVFFERIT